MPIRTFNLSNKSLVDANDPDLLGETDESLEFQELSDFYVAEPTE